MDEKTGEILERFAKDRNNLIPILQELQAAKDHLSAEAIREIGRYLDISENDIYSVASFYPEFRFTRSADHVIKVCLCNICHLQGTERILDSIERELDIQVGQTTEDFKFSLERSSWGGCAASAPLVMIDGDIYSKMTPVKVREMLERYQQ